LEADKLIEYYHRLVKLTNPEMVSYPDEALVRSNRHLIRHAPDVPVLFSAMTSKPDWLLTHNTKHFTRAVAKRTGVRIATPAAFFRTLLLYFGKILGAIFAKGDSGRRLRWTALIVFGHSA
jgi:hypothetical protein